MFIKTTPFNIWHRVKVNFVSFVKQNSKARDRCNMSTLKNQPLSTGMRCSLKYKINWTWVSLTFIHCFQLLHDGNFIILKLLALIKLVTGVFKDRNKFSWQQRWDMPLKTYQYIQDTICDRNFHLYNPCTKCSQPIRLSHINM